VLDPSAGSSTDFLAVAAAGAEEGEGAESSTEFPAVAATGAEEGEGADSSTDFPAVAATGAQRVPHNGNPPPTALGKKLI